MSLGAFVDETEDGAQDLLNALDKATTYAFENGVTVIASAGNDEHDLDNTAHTKTVPAQSANVIAVSATGPIGFGKGATNFDELSSYTNWGQSLVDFAAPGGNDEYRPLTEVCTFPLNPTGTSSIPCYALDFVIAPCRGGPTSVSSYCWSEGTSMAAPAVSGVAALIVGKYGPIAPAMVESILTQSADDVGPEGDDPFYGRGRVNAFRAVQ